MSLLITHLILSICMPNYAEKIVNGGFAPQVHLGTPFLLILYVLKRSSDWIGSLPEVPRL